MKTPSCTCWAQTVEGSRQATTNAVHFCPLHAQAEAMRDFVHGVIVWAMHVSAGGEVDWSQMRDRARALLRATEGREPP